MDTQGKIETINGFIANEQGFLTWSLIKSIVPFILSLVVSGISLYLSFSSDGNMLHNLGETGKILAAIPGACGTAWGAFSIKDYFAGKNRIVSFKLIKIQYESNQANPDETREGQRIDEIFWVLVNKSLG